jgi:hypothetical protein
MAQPAARTEKRAVCSWLFGLVFGLSTTATAFYVAGYPLSPDPGYAFVFNWLVAAALLALSIVAFVSFFAGLFVTHRVPSRVGAAGRGAVVAVAFCLVAYAAFSRTSLSVALLLSVATLIVGSLAAAGALRRVP